MALRKRTGRRPTQKTKQSPSFTKEFLVEGLTHDAKGVARDDGKVTFVEGALPGERVEAYVVKQGRRFDEAKVSKILEESADRVTPECEHYFQCGGCQFQHLTYTKQIDSKLEWLRGQFRKLNIGDIELLSNTSQQYRRRARLSVFSKEGKQQLGFRARNSKDIVNISQCLVLTKPLQVVFDAFKERFNESTLASRIGHIELLDDNLSTSITIRLSRNVSDDDLIDWNKWAESQNVNLYWQQANEQRLPVVNEHFYTIDGLKIYFHPQDFIQVNGPMNEKMVEQAMNWLSPTKDDRILDLFCGSGNFSLPLAKRAGEVVGVEALESMVEYAKSNARVNELDNVTFIAADLTKTAPRILKNKKVTKVLLDPPRSGAFEFLETLVKFKPDQILYVSCNASTLARDAEYLIANGYLVSRVSLMEMFPQTSHSETMMLLQRK
ncbi:23S rRNA (uracil(1939)-C(5))-methyltransferase RlmD [Marinomonas balearica]|uniref:23S rRNA (uracil(1939)-C(5))-methyltransferase RlmD n=1 Tax=Marinomonas balearica TaxID=491947 RepID=A0A4V3CG46_9GAMM|nr:23S rRNA (uracil(1939)-C(5))-methyltransferase RlmD [Marinomonas balearica]TDO96362.1 23S rRNA m(5)U-1939 methyltransferase [Marinomonas balearica]